MIDLPKTTREQLIRMRDNGANKNWINALAHANGVDYDEDTKDEFNRFNNNEND